MPTQTDIRFAQAAVKAGYLSPEKAQELLQAQKTAEDTTGAKADFRKVSQTQNALSPEQIKALEESLGYGQQASQKQFGSYLIQKKIGQGGMGAVYLATDTRVNLPVALKVLPKSFAKDPAYLKRFEREGTLAASIQHENVVRCYGIGEEKGVRYIALEYVDGGDVMDIIKTGPIPEAKALDLGGQVAAALVAAHELGIIHRDIKPQNILFTKEGQAKLGDLGLARQEEDHSVTQTGIAIGTPHYMSPEQAVGQKDIDIRADIYSFGATLYHMVCAKPPFTGGSAMVVLLKQAEEQIPSPRETVPELSDGLCHIIEKCMAKSREDRYQTPAELLNDIQLVQKGEPPASEALAIGASTVQQQGIAKAVERRRERRREETAAAAGSKLPIPAIAGVVGILLVVGALMFFSEKPRPEGKETGAGVSPSKATGKTLPGIAGLSPAQGSITTPVVKSTAPQRIQELEELYNYAIKFVRENPPEYARSIEKLTQVEAAAKGTKWAMMARDKREKMEKTRAEAAQSALKTMQQQVERFQAEGRFGDSLRLVKEFPEKLQPGLQNDALPTLTIEIEGRAKEQFQKWINEAKALQAKQDFAGAELLLTRARGIGLADFEQEAAKKLEDLKDLQASAAERAKRDLERKLNSEILKLRQLTAQREYDTALNRLETLSQNQEFAPVKDSLSLLQTDLQTAKNVYHTALKALPEQVGKTFSIKGIRGKLKEFKDGKLVLSAGGAEFSRPVSDLKTKEFANLALSALQKLAGEKELALAIFYLYSDDGTSIPGARTLLAEAERAGMDISNQQKLCDLFEKGQTEMEAEDLFARSKEAFEAEKWKASLRLLEKLQTEYSKTKFVVDKASTVEEMVSQSKLNSLGLVLWLNASKGIKKDSKENVLRWEDQSGRGNHAEQKVASKRPKWVRRGRKGKSAVGFDGVDDVLTGSNRNNLPTGTSDRTFSLWLHSSNYGVRNCPFIGWGKNAVKQRFAFFLGRGMKPDQRIGLWARGGDSDLWAKTPLTNDKWHHIIYALSKSTGKLYIDGQLQVSKSVSINTPRDTSFSIGKIPLPAGWKPAPFQFMCDDIRIYNRALSEEEVQWLAGIRKRSSAIRPVTKWMSLAQIQPKTMQGAKKGSEWRFARSSLLDRNKHPLLKLVPDGTPHLNWDKVDSWLFLHPWVNEKFAVTYKFQQPCTAFRTQIYNPALNGNSRYDIAVSANGKEVLRKHINRRLAPQTIEYLGRFKSLTITIDPKGSNNGDWGLLINPQVRK